MGATDALVRVGDTIMAQAVAYSLFVADSFVGRCGRFEIATALAEEFIDSTGKPRMRIECAENPSRLRAWDYNYDGEAWVETR